MVGGWDYPLGKDVPNVWHLKSIYLNCLQELVKLKKMTNDCFVKLNKRWSFWNPTFGEPPSLI